MARKYFGTDGVRGIVGEKLTLELVERLGKAASLWSGRGRVFVGRDTRGSGPELEEALARGIVAAGGAAVLGGVLPTPAVALLALDLGAVISASHNPPEYNGVKLFDRDGHKLTDEQEEEIEALFDAAAPGDGEIDHVEVATDSYLEHVVERFGSDLSKLKIAVDCAGDRMLAVDGQGNTVDGDQIVAILALHLGVDLVAVTVMSNLGLHQLLREHGIEVLTTAVGDRYVLEALRERNGLLGGEQSGHIIYLRDHVTGDGLASALLLCGALDEHTLAEAAAVMHRYPQVKENLPLPANGLPAGLEEEVARLNEGLEGTARVLVRPSGTEPVIRLLAEAPTEAEARDLCGTIAALVTREPR